ncbi:MAG: hypothetical protein EZS28_016937 [Streblomastix strix]|uniref:Protein kinase domain-containing protein n=1 Tax=Streblomastix strix TaxID=222440 RepID=A0A5J4VY83_9EUKA|nr:MAG: hypothetical protein EZS28_016937 [Streblomastix strix]
MELERRNVLQKQGFKAKGHLAIHNEKLGIVAAKIVNSEDFRIDEQLAGQQLTQGYQSPFILKFISASIYENHTIILAEYANMKNLNDLIEAKRELPVPLIRAIIGQLLEGLRLMHEKGLIHRFE